mgnify:FL=1
MNKIKYLIALLVLCSSCGEKLIEEIFHTKATIYLINESSVIVKSDNTLNYTLHPGERIIHKESNSLDGDRPNINQYFLSFLQKNNTFTYNDDNSKCEKRIYDILSYENRKELAKVGDTLIFEFTFRFTEEKKAQAEPCN